MVFDSEPWVDWAANNPSLPTGAVVVYVLCVARAPAGMAVPDAPALRRALVAWNIGMALFALWCSAVALPHYLFGSEGLWTRGTVASICSDVSWYSQGAPGAVATAFTVSKFFELFDTLFLALRGRPLTKLHTFHHAATLLLTWRLFASRASTGLVFITMNAAVHAVMYAYFAAMIFPEARGMLLPRGHYITLLQIAQMAAGVLFNLLAANEIVAGRACQVPPSCVAGTGLLYSVYMAMFIQFAVQRKRLKRA